MSRTDRELQSLGSLERQGTEHQRIQLIDRRVLLRSAFATLAVHVLAILAGLAAQILMARVLGASSFGILAFALALALLVTVPVKLGLESAALHFIPVYRVAGRSTEVRGFVIGSRRLVCLVASGTAILGVALLQIVWPGIGEELKWSIVLAALLLPARAALELDQSFLRALRRPVAGVAVARLVQPLAAITLFLIAVFVLGAARTAPTGMAATVAAVVVSLVVSATLVRSSSQSPVRVTSPVFHYRTWLRYSTPLLLLTGFWILINQTDTLMVGTLIGMSDAGKYAVSSRVAGVLSLGLMSFNALLAPLISELWSTRRLTELQSHVTSAARWVSLLTLSASVILVFLAPRILSLFGPGFETGAAALRILALGQVVNALSGSVGWLMTMTGHHMTATRVLGGCAILNIALNFVLIPRLGMAGAAIATATTTAAWNLILVMLVKARLGITSWVK